MFIPSLGPAEIYDRPVTGNIYCDRFTDQGKQYRCYTIDCAKCGCEVSLERVWQGGTKKAALRMGWVLDPKTEKWVCEECKNGRP